MKLLLGDCLELMKTIPTGSVDMVMCDLPYGTTACKWDSIIPLEPLWKEYRRICKGAVVLTAAQPFTSALVMSNPSAFKHEWMWRKKYGSGHLNAKRQPMRIHESVLVFGSGVLRYFPQMREGVPYKSSATRQENQSRTFGKHKQVSVTNEGTRFPTTDLQFDAVDNRHGRLHPTQKPVALMEYLIRTYTNPGDTVLDTGREFIGIERDPTYFAIAEKRIREAELNNY